MQIFELFGEILLKDNGVTKQLDDFDKKAKNTNSIFDTAFGKIGSSALKLGATLGIGLGITSLIKKAYDFAESASNLSEAQNVVETTFKTSGKAIEAWASTTASSAGISKTASTQWVGFMGAMLKSSGVSETSSANMSKNLVQLTGDMSSFYNVDTKDMWEKLRSGISGETEPLKALGINMSVANLSSYALAEGIKKPYAQMTQGEQTTLRYNYLMKTTADAQGDFGKTLSTSFANQVRVAKLNLEGLGQSIGTVVLPYFMKLVSWVNDNMPKIQSVIKTATDGIISSVQTIAPIIGNVITTIRDNLGLIKTGLELLGVAWVIHKGYILITSAALLVHNGILLVKKGLDMAETVQIWLLIAADKARAIATGISTVATTVATVATTAFGVALKVAMGPVGLIIAALVLLGIGIYEIVTHWDVIKAKTLEVWATIKTFLFSAWDSIKSTVSSVFTSIKTFFSDVWTSIKTTTENIWNGIKTFFSNVWDGIKTIFTNLVTAIVTFVNDKFGFLIEGIKGIFNGVKTFFTGVWDAIKTIFLGTILLILDLVTGNFGELRDNAVKIFNKLKDSFSEIWNGIKQIFSSIIGIIATALTNAFNNIVNGAKTLWDGFKTFMSNLWDGIKTTASNVWTSIKTTISNLITGIVEGAKNIWNGLKSFLSSLWDGIKTTASNGFNALKNAIVSIVTSSVNGWINIFNGIITFFKGLPGTLQTLGTNAFNGLKNGISSIMSTIGTVVKNGFNSAIAFLKALPAQMLGYGKDMIQGMINGITSMIGGITSAVSGVADKIKSFLHFSVPDEGPLTDYESWMPDFMNGMAKGIDANKFKVIDSIKSLTGDMKVNTNANITSIGTKNTQDSVDTSNTKQGITQTVNIYSPTALSPSEIARQNKRALQELAFNF